MSGAAKVVDDVDQPIRCLLPIGIGHAESLIEHQAAAPRFALVCGDEGHQMGSAGFPVEGTVFDEQQTPRGEATDCSDRMGVMVNPVNNWSEIWSENGLKNGGFRFSLFP